MIDFKQIERNLEEEIAKATLKDWIIFCFIIIIGIAISCFAINQVLDAIYNINVASDPCGVCRELNPNVKIINTPNIYNITFEVMK